MADCETILCDNCGREIGAANHTVHVSHCRRHLGVCPECGETVPRARMDEHRASEHRRVDCRLCGQQVFSGLMDVHQEESCSGRAVTCPYCELSMPFSSLEEHESYCGARTEPCPTCDARVMYKHWPLHVQSGHTLTRPERPRTPPKAGGDKWAGTRRASLRQETTPGKSFGDHVSLDDKIASYVRKPVDEIVEDTMESWRKRKELRKFEDDCFEQAMLMAIELSKASAEDEPGKPVPCRRCGRRFPAEEVTRHQDSCSDERRGCWPEDDDAVTLPCEFCESAFLDADLLRHQVRSQRAQGWREENLELTDAPPKTPHRKSKHKKKVNFLGQDEFIHPEPEYVGEVVEGEKKKKKHKKRSSKKHRAPEPPGEPASPLLTYDY
ncbi:TRAF-type zinc finger domain-containing protein 1-like [Pollicipes pollicipes]|uniref:TRAF-type zinc finger domain-containing protein 1-like n=1 Tax=Pollicipes pollicipes TaxID=41117 RepID=UPI0018851993|nr:TRAF-type zinc finger domain-containing protein 1-like [Pollicipes pollicipes]